MKVNKKSTLKAKVLTAALLVLFLGSCAVLIFAIFTGQLSREDKKTPTESTAPVETVINTEDNTEASSVSFTEPEAEASTPAETSASDTASSANSLGTSYDAQYWVEHKAEHGTNGLAVLFGAKTQGVSVNFIDGNRFSVNVTSYNESHEMETGTYIFTTDGNIELRYDNSFIATANVLETKNGTITSMDFPMSFEDTTLRLSLAD